VLRTSPFIIPAQPALRVRPPAGDAWLHEVKFDGYRCQPHKVCWHCVWQGNGTGLDRDVSRVF